MFSVENYYQILYYNLFKSFSIEVFFFKNFGSSDISDLDTIPERCKPQHFILMHDQEPVHKKFLNQLSANDFWPMQTRRLRIFCSSEKSDIVEKYCKENNYQHLYYFFHGFLSLDWYNDGQYLQELDFPINKNYMCLNNLVTNDRSYRLNLVSSLIENKILDSGSVSCNFDHDMLKKELFDPDSLLSKSAKLRITKNLLKHPSPISINNDIVNGVNSAHFGKNEIKLWQESFIHVVTETNFYHNKLHLTEKIFKPIVAKRPFILVAAPGNLEYLKSYGFKTFSQWIDESYDQETDHDKRISLIVNETKKIAGLNLRQIKQVKQEMQEVLDYNFNHFYNNFKKILIDEFVENFKNCLHRYNHGKLDDSTFQYKNYDFDQFKKTMLL